LPEHRVVLEQGGLGKDSVGEYQYKIVRCTLCDVVTVIRNYGTAISTNWTERRFEDPHLKEFIKRQSHV
jgi:hypothetical protein